MGHHPRSTPDVGIRHACTARERTPSSPLPPGCRSPPLPIFVVAAAVLTLPVQTPVAVASDPGCRVRRAVRRVGPRSGGRRSRGARSLTNGCGPTGRPASGQSTRPGRSRSEPPWRRESRSPGGTGAACFGLARKQLPPAKYEILGGSPTATSPSTASGASWTSTPGARPSSIAREELIGAHLWEAFPELVGSRAYGLYRAVAGGVPSVRHGIARPAGSTPGGQAYPSPGGCPSISRMSRTATARRRRCARTRSVSAPSSRTRRTSSPWWTWSGGSASSVRPSGACSAIRPTT